MDTKIYDYLKIMKKLVDDVLRNHDIHIHFFLWDGSYDRNENLIYRLGKKIQPGINIKSNYIVASKKT